MSDSGPYHAGERQVQVLAGQAARAEAMGHAIATSIIPGAWGFLAGQSMLVLGSWDGKRGAWPSIVFGAAGFITTSDGKNIRLALDKTWVDTDDPFWQNIRRNGLVSILAIELASRRRLRINGHLSRVPDESPGTYELNVVVDQAYPNCHKYIQRRTLQIDRTDAMRAEIHEGRALDAGQSRLVAGADTFFVASVHRESGADISHRGGAPGFVQVESATRLRIPDYAGNGMFNTLGNIHASGYAGMLFIDFVRNRQLQIIGDAHIDWTRQSETVVRSWIMDIRHVRDTSLPSGLTWKFIDFSSLNPAQS